MSSALQLVFVGDSVLLHVLTYDFPGLAVDAELAHEFLMQFGWPKVWLLLLNDVIIRAALALLLAIFFFLLFVFDFFGKL